MMTVLAVLSARDMLPRVHSLKALSAGWRRPAYLLKASATGVSAAPRLNGIAAALRGVCG